MGTEEAVSIFWTWRIEHAEPRTVAGSRHAFADELRRNGLGESDVESAVLILGELLANACEHGRVPVDIQLRSHGVKLELDVADSGVDITRPRQRDPMSLRGRGFEIIERLGGRIALRKRPRSGVRVQLPLQLSA
jgi:anti-sigma regulatory factor (Ser/Thr protein kinase)